MTGLDLSRRSLFPLAVGFWATASGGIEEPLIDVLGR